MSKVAKNYILSLTYRLSSLLLPLITIPYISRVLGKNSIGVFAFTNSIVEYFVLFGTLGVGLYGVRAIAYIRDDKKQLSKDFWAIFFMKLITISISIISFLIWLFVINPNYFYIYLIQSINLFAFAFDISWFFMGLEEFKKIVTRDLLIKIIGVLLYFLFVKTASDLWKYTLIVTGTNFIRLSFFWVYVPKFVQPTKISLKDIWKHVIPNIKLFIPQIAGQLYQFVDKTMLGLITTKADVGIYDRADRMIKMSFGIISSLTLVIMPKMSNLFANNNIQKIKDYIAKSFSFLSLLSIPITMGFIGISNQMVPWFFGNDFLEVSKLLLIISPIIIIKAWSSVIGNQLMISMKLEVKYTISIFIGFFSNIVMNLIFIPKLHSIGAAIASIGASLIILIIQIISVFKILPIKKMIYDLWKYFISAACMLIVIKIIGYYIDIKILTTILQIIFGFIFYIILLFLFKSSGLKMIITNIKNILLSKTKKDK